jgi:hypothetical protein
MRAREDHQLLVHRHRHSYWQTELLVPETESNIPWRSPIVIGAVGRVAASRGCGEAGVGREMGVLVVRVWGRESDGRGTSANPELNRVEL